MLAGAVEFVIGVDTHRDSHTAAVVNAATGGVVDQLSVATDAFGFRRLKAFADQHADGSRVWAIEGTGSYGAGLTTSLLEAGEWVVEIDRPARPARRDGAKSDDLDAVRAAREALSRQHLAQPRARGDREALRVLMAARQGAVVGRTKAIGQLKALIVNAPQVLRDQLRRGTTDEQLQRCARLRTLPTHSIEHRATVQAIRGTARRALALEAEAAEYETELERLVVAIGACPRVLDTWNPAGAGGSEMIRIMARKNYSDEFRRQAVDLYESTPDATLRGIAADLGVSRGTLADWVKTFGTGSTTMLPAERTTSGARSGSTETAAVRIARLEAENARLRAEKVKVETERDILRKAAKYFAGETNW